MQDKCELFLIEELTVDHAGFSDFFNGLYTNQSIVPSDMLPQLSWDVGRSATLSFGAPRLGRIRLGLVVWKDIDQLSAAS